MKVPAWPTGKSGLRNYMNNVRFMLSIFVAVALTMTTVSCAPKATTTTTKTTVKPVTTTTTPKTTSATTTTASTTTSTAAAVATTKTTTATTPTLAQTTFSLLITPPQTYAEYTLPIYLSADDTIHLVWTVSGVGEHIRMAINTPGGQYIGVKINGGFTVLTTDKPCDALYRSGSVVLKPSDQQWAEGYYIFHPYIAQTDPNVTVKIMYWIEH